MMMMMMMMKYSYLIPIIFKQIDLTLTVTTTLDQSGPGRNHNEGVVHFLRSSELEPHHQIQFSVIPRTLLGRVLHLCWEYSQSIQSLTTHIYQCIYIYIYISWLTIVKGDLKAPFSIAITTRCRGGHYTLPWMLHLPLIHTL